MREAVGLTQEHLAFRSGVTVSMIKRAERGFMPKVEGLEKITLALGVPMDDLIKAIRSSASVPDDDEPEELTG